MTRLASALFDVLDTHLPRELKRFISHWPTTEVSRDEAPVGLPATRWLNQLSVPDDATLEALVDAAVDTYDSHVWRQSYTEDDFSADFIANYGFVEQVGQRSVLRSARMAAGILLFGPGQDYPAHRHHAEEIYLPVAGEASYLMADGSWQVHGPGAVIHNAPMVWHGTRTKDTPVLIAWAWLGNDLTQKSEIE